MHHFEKVFQCFPKGIQQQIHQMDPWSKQNIEEIRVYKGKEVYLFAGGKRIPLSGRMEGSDIHNLLNHLMKYSYYAYEED